MADFDDMIESVAKGPKSVSTDGTKVDAQGIDELIKADQHLKAKEGVASTRHRGIRFSKLSPPGTTS